jgi:hypothetical protein
VHPEPPMCFPWQVSPEPEEAPPNLGYS